MQVLIVKMVKKMIDGEERHVKEIAGEISTCLCRKSNDPQITSLVLGL